MLIHDYGFAGRSPTRASTRRRRSVPGFVRLDYPETAGVPKSFFRVYGNEDAREVQITNDVNFGELAELLAPTGLCSRCRTATCSTTVREFPDFFFKGDGVVPQRVPDARPPRTTCRRCSPTCTPGRPSCASAT